MPINIANAKVTDTIILQDVTQEILDSGKIKDYDKAQKKAESILPAVMSAFKKTGEGYAPWADENLSEVVSDLC